jgi:twinkle protein
MDSFNKFGIKIPAGATGDVKTICPECTPHNRKPENRNSKDLSVNVEQGVWNCKNCLWKGSLKAKHYVRPEPIPESKINLSDKALEWFKSRGISKNTLQVFKVHSDTQWFPQTGKEGTCIAFPYFRDNRLVNCKYRDALKNFKMIKDAELVFYNLAALEGAKECLIVEGEIDCLSVYEAGYYNVLSVPNGATKGGKLEYLDNCWKDFENIETIILATDNDEPGLVLRNELARRFGKHRCKYIQMDAKDMNEALVKGYDIKKIISEAIPFPIDGVVRLKDFEADVDRIFENGIEPGKDTGFMEFDEHLRIRKGEFTIVTGIPGSGKSKFIDQLAGRLATKHGWKVGFCSPEKELPLHVGSLISQFVGQSFYAKDPRYKIVQEDYETAKWYVNDHFFFYVFSQVDNTVQGIADKAIELVKAHGIDMLIVDPWNYLEHLCPPGMTETQYTSKALDILLKFAKIYDVAVILVAHPTKIKKEAGKYEIPTLYQISGSANFFNKTDNGFTVYRDYQTGEVVVYIQKVRNEFVGKIGQVSFRYDKFTGRYSETGDFISDSKFLERRLRDQLNLDL